MTKPRPSRWSGLRPNPHTLGVTPLTAGEVSKPVRVRAAAEVHTWLGTLTAAQVGAHLADAYRAHLEAQMRHAGATVSALQPQGAAVALRPGSAASTAKQPNHVGILADLDAGATLTGAEGVYTLTGADGRRRTVHPKTASHMIKTGMLTADPHPDRGGESVREC